MHQVSKLPASWEGEGIPDALIKLIKASGPSYFLDVLVHHFVFRNRYRIYKTFYCSNCHYSKSVERYHDEVTYCYSCGSQLLYCTQTIDFPKKVLNYSRTNEVSLFDIVEQMDNNFIILLKRHLFSQFSCGMLSDGRTYCKFPFGMTVVDSLQRVCLLKAAILCPYLWKSMNEWCEIERNCNQHFSPLIRAVTQNKSRLLPLPPIGIFQ